jgi:DNA-binding response OmpR family regulator
MSWSDSLESAVIASGADGFVRKTFRPSELTAAIVAAGRAPEPA